MVSVAYYRAETERCRALAAGAHDPEVAARWLRIAQDYENLAKSLESAPESVPPPVMRVSMQQQPVQQQQTKTTPEPKPSVLVMANQTGGFRWRVILDGQTVGSGDAPTEFYARNAAGEIVKRIEAKPPEAP